MVEYSCEKCGKSFGNNKHHLLTHHNRKFPCKQINLKSNIDIAKHQNDTIKHRYDTIKHQNDTIKHQNDTIKHQDEIDNLQTNSEILNNLNKNSIIPKEIKCPYCLDKFTRKSSLIRHLKNRCKEKDDENIDDNQNNIDNNQNNINNNQNEKIDVLIELNKQLIKQNEQNMIQQEELKNKIIELEKKTKVTSKKIKRNKSNYQIYKSTNNNNLMSNSNNTNNLTSNSNNNINIQINKYGTENYDELDNKLFLEPMMKEIGKQIFLKMIKNVYINPDLPQNHNIVVTDKNRQICKIHDGERWTTTDTKIINDLLGRIIEYSKTKHDQYVEKYGANKKVNDRLKVTKKYIDKCDQDRLAELEDKQANEEADNKEEIKRCKDFYEMVYKDIINLLHDYKDIIVK